MPLRTKIKGVSQWVLHFAIKARNLVPKWVRHAPVRKPSEETFMVISPIRTLRYFSRVPFSAEVELQLQDRGMHVQLMDIALKGALVKVTGLHALVPQESCRLVLPLADGGESIVMTGKIAHLEGEFVGIECLNIDLSSLTQLRRLIELNTGDADLADRELAHLFTPRSPA